MQLDFENEGRQAKDSMIAYMERKGVFDLVVNYIEDYSSVISSSAKAIGCALYFNEFKNPSDRVSRYRRTPSTKEGTLPTLMPPSPTNAPTE